MPDEFETLETKATTASHLKATARKLRGVPHGLTVDPTRGQQVAVGERRWTFLMTLEIADQWEDMNRKPLVLGLLAYHALDVEDPFVHRMLVVLPGRSGALAIEMRDSEGRVLWTGSAERVGDELRFSMPISRPGSSITGRVVGRVTRKGQLKFEEARLPKPVRKKTPEFESED
jgi:hypothetical protein